MIAATGRHRRALYADDDPIAARSVDGLTELFIDDISSRRCGLIKVGVDASALDRWEVDSLTAAARAAIATGAPVALHLEGGRGAAAVVDLLGRAGVGPERVILGHVGRSQDIADVRAAAATGAWLCFDGPSPTYRTTAEGLLRQLSMLADAGHAARLLLGSDTTTRAARADGRTGNALLAATRAGRAALDPALRRLVLEKNPASAWLFTRVPG